MSINTEPAKRHVKDHGVNYMIGLVTSTFALIVGFITLVTVGDPYHATEFEVGEIVIMAVEEHSNVAHAGITEAIAQISWIYVGDLEERIDEIYMWQCSNANDRARDAELRDLRTKYFNTAKREYHKNIRDFC